MNSIEVSVRFCVFFDDPYWVGLLERRAKGKVSYCRVVFGAEPKIFEILDFVRSRYHTLVYSPALDSINRIGFGRINPKRKQRMIAKEMRHIGRSTFAQAALQLQREENKLEQRKNLRKRREEDNKRKFALKQARKKEKRKGR